MKITTTIRLLPTPAESATLHSTVARINLACNWLSERAFSTGTFRQFDIHKAFYKSVRSIFGLPSQSTVRAIADVAAAYESRKHTLVAFRSNGSVSFDARNSDIRPDRVRLTSLTPGEPLRLEYVATDAQRARLARHGQLRLFCRDSMWFIAASVEVDEPVLDEPAGFIGVDMGVVNIATVHIPATAEAAEKTVFHCGKALRLRREKHRRTLRSLQKRNTSSSRQKVRRIGHRQSLRNEQENHELSKRIVTAAKALGMAICLEDLSGIRKTEPTVGRELRRRLGGWAFHRLRFFVEYKARMAGVQVVVVSPKDTSRTCPACGNCDEGNRKSQSDFVCLACGLTDNADTIGAENISGRGRLVWAKRPPAPKPKRTGKYGSSGLLNPLVQSEHKEIGGVAIPLRTHPPRGGRGHRKTARSSIRSGTQSPTDGE